MRFYKSYNVEYRRNIIPLIVGDRGKVNPFYDYKNAVYFCILGRQYNHIMVFDGEDINLILNDKNCKCLTLFTLSKMD